MALWTGIRTSAHTLRREPGFATLAILTLALGIGANTAIFSIVNGVLLRPLPYSDPDRLVVLREVIPAVAQTYPTLPASGRHFVEWRQRASSFERISLVDTGSVSLTGNGEPEQLDAARVSADMFRTLGVRAAFGRTFVDGEDQEGRERVAVISDALWRRRFHADPSVVGKTVNLDSVAHTIVGVLPASFRFPAATSALPGQGVVAHPEIFEPKTLRKQELENLMGMFNYTVLARLKKGVTREQALAEMNVIAAQLDKLSGENVKLRAVVTPLESAVTGTSRLGLLVLLGAVGSVLLIVCVNLANLMLARAERRSRESAIRTALGASRGQLIRMALVETLLIAFAGGALGVALAAGGLGALVKSAPADIPRLNEVALDGRVLLFAFAITAATGLLFGLAPAWRSAHADPQAALKSGGRSASGGTGARRFRSMLVGAEVGLSAVLLITAALLMTSFVRLMRADKGFEAPTVVAVDLAIPHARYSEDAQVNLFHERLLARLRAQPGVLSAAISTALPLQGETWVDDISLPGEPRGNFSNLTTNVRFISADYFRTMGIPLRAGRTFSDNDRKRDVLVIAERLARKLWLRGEDPLGRKVVSSTKTYEVIGVAGDIRTNADKPPVAMIYKPSWAWAPVRAMLVARAAGDPRSIMGAVRASIRAVDADVPVPEMRTMRELLDESVAQRRFQMTLAGAFAATALLLAALGIYGVVSYSVARRTNEMGIRMALGARSGQLHGLVVRQSMTPVALGLAAGVAAALGAGRVLGSLLYEVSPRDPVAIAAVVGLLGAVAAAASYVPARRATAIDPLDALRCD